MLGTEYSVFQLTATYDSKEGPEQNLLFFNYELSPISVQFYKHRESVFEFTIMICGVIGGVFTIAGIIDSIIHKSFSVLFKKRIGKIS